VPSLPPSLTRDLAMRLVGASNEPLPDAEEMQPLEGNRARGNSNAVNRERVQDSQRVIAGETILNTTVLMGCVAIVFFGIVVAGVVIYVTGWMVWSKSRDQPCDQPLQWWLFTMLLIPVVQCQLNNHIDERPKRLQALVMPTLLCSGIYFLTKCKTCAETNPSLYDFVKMYIIFQSVLWLAMMFTVLCFVTVIMWAHQRGLLPHQGGGPSNPAKPGTINEIETVSFSPDLFADIAVGKPPDESPECSICQDVFDHQKVIKRTPCGHFFHEECLASWLEKFAKTCPLCRMNIEEALEQRGQP